MLLNNDAVVTDGWLDQLIALTAARPEITREAGRPVRDRRTRSTETRGSRRRRRIRRELAGIGLVGPMSNYAAPPQLVEERAVSRPGRDARVRPAVARRAPRASGSPSGKLSGFCLLMKRAVYDAIGGLDERFGLGFFDDDDLAERARRAGFELAVAHDLFVHHFGSRTFAGNGIDAERLLEENARRFADKWGHDGPAGRRVALQPWSRISRQRRSLGRRSETPDRRRGQVELATDTSTSDSA